MIYSLLNRSSPIPDSLINIWCLRLSDMYLRRTRSWTVAQSLYDLRDQFFGWHCCTTRWLEESSPIGSNQHDAIVLPMPRLCWICVIRISWVRLWRVPRIDALAFSKPTTVRQWCSSCTMDTCIRVIRISTDTSFLVA